MRRRKLEAVSLLVLCASLVAAVAASAAPRQTVSVFFVRG